MARPRLWAMLGGLGAVGWGLWMLGSWGAVESAAVEPSCTRAVMVDDQLRCGVEIPAEPAELCSGTGPRTESTVRAGDAFDTVQLCAHSTVEAYQPGHGWTRMDPESLTALEQPVDLNRASVAELASLPRVGPVLARRIVDGRPYATLEELERVRGIGPVTLARLRPRGRVRPRAL